jgi:hypothetical protein
MISYQSIVDKITTFYDNHLQVKKVGSDFKEQLWLTLLLQMRSIL